MSVDECKKNFLLKKLFQQTIPWLKLLIALERNAGMFFENRDLSPEQMKFAKNKNVKVDFKNWRIERKGTGKEDVKVRFRGK